MKYPTMEEVEAADRVQLCRWYRFLRSPGDRDIAIPRDRMPWEDQPTFKARIEMESSIMNLICQRFCEAGGFTPGISNVIGWEE